MQSDLSLSHTDHKPLKLALALAGVALLGVWLYHASPAVHEAVLIALATLVSEDLTIIHVGVLARQGHIGFLRGTLACFAGIFLGDVLLYLAGRWAGEAALSRAPLKWFLSERTVRRSAQWLQQRGALVVLLSRFIPGTRLPTYFAAGALRTPFWQFVFYFLLACGVWAPTLIGLSAWLGEMFVTDRLRSGGLAIVAFAVTFWLVLRWLLQMTTWNGRRRWLGRVRRWTHWEFWPLYLVYPPVVLYLCWLALKHRSVTAFMAANPAISTGGLVGESKSAILDGLRNVPDFVARYVLLSAESSFAERLAQAEAFMTTHQLSFPIVLKPDVGQRGAGVRILRSADELHAALQQMKTPHFLQEYIAGVEFGVFYYRLPAAAQGQIFSITEKRFPTVTGDGAQTLEELVLADERAVCLAPTYAQRLSARWHDVIPAGATVTLAELGSHCRGAVFLDGAAYQTQPLAAAIERISQSYPGFYFGRYDIRAASVEAFQRGAFKVIELNGVSSEATHIYDPQHSVWEAYRVLFAQWRIAFAIGAANRGAWTPDQR